MDVIQLITAAGLGGIIVSFLTSWLADRSAVKIRNFQEKKEAYVGLLEAFHKAAVYRTEETAKNFAYWQIRCAVIAPKMIRDAVQKIVDTNDDSSERHIALEKLMEVIRKDLGVHLGN